MEYMHLCYTLRAYVDFERRLESNIFSRLMTDRSMTLMLMMMLGEENDEEDHDGFVLEEERELEGQIDDVGEDNGR